MLDTVMIAVPDSFSQTVRSQKEAAFFRRSCKRESGKNLTVPLPAMRHCRRTLQARGLISVRKARGCARIFISIKIIINQSLSRRNRTHSRHSRRCVTVPRHYEPDMSRRRTMRCITICCTFSRLPSAPRLARIVGIN